MCPSCELAHELKKGQAQASRSAAGIQAGSRIDPVERVANAGGVWITLVGFGQAIRWLVRAAPARNWAWPPNLQDRALRAFHDSVGM